MMRWLTDSERKMLLVLVALLLGGALIKTFPFYHPPAMNVVSSTDATTSLSKVAINQASLDELISIPGIGPVLAQRIIHYREEKGIIKTSEELLDVKGIGPASLEKITKYIVFR